MTVSTCSVGSSSNTAYRAYPFAVLEACFGWCRVWTYRLTQEEVAQRQAELEERYPGCDVHVFPYGESVTLKSERWL